MPTLTPRIDCARAAHQTASAVLPTPSVMPAMLVSISAMAFVSQLLSPALQDSSDTTESATRPVPLVLALRATSAREPALLEHGLIMEVAIDTVLLLLPLLMLVSTHAPVEPPLSTEFVKLDLKLVLLDNSTMVQSLHAETVCSLAPNAL